MLTTHFAVFLVCAYVCLLLSRFYTALSYRSSRSVFWFFWNLVDLPAYTLTYSSIRVHLFIYITHRLILLPEFMLLLFFHSSIILVPSCFCRCFVSVCLRSLAAATKHSFYAPHSSPHPRPGYARPPRVLGLRMWHRRSTATATTLGSYLAVHQVIIRQEHITSTRTVSDPPSCSQVPPTNIIVHGTKLSKMHT